MSILSGLSGVTAQDLLKIVPGTEQDQSPEKLGTEESVTMKQLIMTHVTETHALSDASGTGETGAHVLRPVVWEQQRQEQLSLKMIQKITILVKKRMPPILQTVTSLRVSVSGQSGVHVQVLNLVATEIRREERIQPELRMEIETVLHQQTTLRLASVGMR